ncbi:hypothetical protein ACLOJK_026097 [Asimina triloba]
MSGRRGQTKRDGRNAVGRSQVTRGREIQRKEARGFRDNSGTSMGVESRGRAVGRGWKMRLWVGRWLAEGARGRSRERAGDRSWEGEVERGRCRRWVTTGRGMWGGWSERERAGDAEPWVEMRKGEAESVRFKEDPLERDVG